MIDILADTHEDLLALKISDGVSRDDYEKVVPVIDNKVEQFKKIRLYAEIGSFSDIGLGALWEDLKVDLKYYNNFSKIAVVGPQDWKEDLVKIAKQLVPADVKYFDETETDTAKEWIK